MVAGEDEAPPGPERIDHGPDLVAVRAGNPGPMTLDGTRSYVLGRSHVVIVDPGPAEPAQLEMLASAVGGRHVAWILLTHSHADHAAGAFAAATRFGAPIGGSATTLARIGRADRVEARELEDGETLALEDRLTITALHAPGHTDDHVCYLADPGRRLFTGDLVLGEGSSAILHPEGSVADCLASLVRMASLRPRLLLPGHGPAVEEAEARIAAYRRHRLEREVQVREALAAGASTVPEIRELVYGSLPAGLRRAADASVAAHLAALAVRGEPVPEIDAYAFTEGEADAPGPAG